MVAVNSTITDLLNEHDLARITGMSIASVRRWRLLRQGPKFIKLGAAVRYKPEDIVAWLDSRPTGGESNPAARVESAEPKSCETRRPTQKKGSAQ
jgi:predicted DNA-binding transcriptional regulator AlpA